MKRGLDLLVSSAGLAILWPLLLLLALVIRLDSPGPALHWSQRFGRDNRLFRMPKFRTMRTDAPDVATEALEDPDRWITRAGRWLRRTSLDELPQLWSILVGDMTLVGPRPALHSQHDLIDLRTRAGVHVLRPGLTGWAQINGRDVIDLERKVELDIEYLHRRSLGLDLAILLLTLRVALSGRNVRH
ncbi:sugar transferase [Phenylobacterium sp.]|uniref:sugar transferase n=1 Tax=Phenylobacterium sp. TaxID=1871053 RepID=UPI0025EC98DF|nr:sugar transferase [Phenylobacterium sp.]MCA3721472.1 sugar transferase [Phenylobacterium sp.]